MPTCLYLRGVPGSGKHTVAELLSRDLGWPLVWVHSFDPVYAAIGDYKVPYLTDRLILNVATHLMIRKSNLIVVRPSRSVEGMRFVANQCNSRGDYRFIPVQLTAAYSTLATRVTRRHYESPFRITTAAALDEYLEARSPEAFPGETIIETDDLEPEQVAERIKELLA